MDLSGTITGIDPPCGRVVLLRRWRHEAVVAWSTLIDLLFVDGDHSWAGIDRDWRGWRRHVVPGGAVASHDSRSVSGRPNLDSRR
ncbi:MAG TPA: class I SAM-dependent methyltransferase [Gemmatimonadales bacterium]|jgi:hypothetical protein|nr:class I SAM-dependent methyltransferase [Gemmatimonadales bacterium]